MKTVARIRFRHVLVALLGYALAATPMFAWAVPGVVTRCGNRPILDQMFTWTAAVAADLLSTCGSRGRTAYVHLQAVDLIYPVALATMLVVATGWLMGRARVSRWWLLVPAVANMAFDYLENASVWALLLGWPNESDIVANIGGGVTALKSAFGMAAFGIPVGLAVVVLVRRLRPPGRDQGAAHEGATG